MISTRHKIDGFAALLLIKSLWDVKRRRWSDRANTVWAIMAANQTNRETISSSSHLLSPEHRTMAEIENTKKERNQMRQQKRGILKGLNREWSTARRTRSRRSTHQISKVKKGVTSPRCLRCKLPIKLVNPHLHPPNSLRNPSEQQQRKE